MNLAVGFFDGVHLGHQRILARAHAALTFLEHPATVFAPDRAPRLLMSAPARLRAVGAALAPSDLPPEIRVRALAFTRALAAEPPERFADGLRAFYPGLETLFCGANWTFGAGGAGDAAFLRARGFRVEVVPYAEHAGAPVSSTRIRAALASGDVAAANAMLGRAYALVGPVKSGKGLGRALGFPTLNIHPDVADPPLRPGVYAVSTPFGRGLANYGRAPTLGPDAWPHPVLEVHLLAPPEDVSAPGAVTVSFLSFIRPEQTFASPAALAAQIARDIAAVQAARAHADASVV